MRRFLLSLPVLFAMGAASGQFTLTIPTYSQSFDGLGIGTSAGVTGGDLNLVSPALNGWYFLETGTANNTTITAGTGSSNIGDTYNFGAAVGANRTLGGLQSGTLNPTFGFYFTNNTGGPINSLAVTYTGETWRVGTASRVDRLDFQYSTNATTLAGGGIWFDYPGLGYNNIAQPAGNGSVLHSASVTATLTGVTIPNGANFFIRWTDFDASGADDGMGVNDFSFTASYIPATTEYYRSAASGNWATLATWESSPDNIVWSPATVPPTSVANTITIRNGHTVTVAVPTTSADQLIIENGGVLDHSLGVFTIDDGIGDDVDVQAGSVFNLSSTANPPSFAAGATCNVASGGTLRVSAGGLTDAAPLPGVNALNFVYQDQSILEYTLVLAFSTDNVTYFPNVNAVTIPIFRTTQNMGSLGAINNTVWNGKFEANGTVTFINSGTKTFRNGIRGTGNISGLASGKFIINGATAELGGSGSLTVPTTGGLEIGAPTTVSMTSDKTITGNVSLLLTGSYINLGNFNLTVSGKVSQTTVDSYVRTNGTGKLILNNVGFGVNGKLFPIGLTSINPLFIQSGITANYSARIVEPITPPIYANIQAVLRTWYITSSVNTPNAVISFGYSFPGDCGVLYSNAGPAELGVNISGIWNIHHTGLTPNAFPLVPGTFIVTPNPINYFNNPATEFPFVIANNYAILPIDCIVSTRAQKRNNTGIISWTVNSCSEVNSFEVQRSVNNSGFQTIGTVNPVVNQTDFSFTDPALAAGTNLYRIKVNGFTGSSKYSNTVALIHNSNDILISSLAPNPVHNKAMLVVSSGRNAIVDFKVYNMSGSLVKQWQSSVAEGNNMIDVNLAGLSVGIYSVFASAKGSTTVSRFVKQ